MKKTFETNGTVQGVPIGFQIIYTKHSNYSCMEFAIMVIKSYK